MKKAKSVPKHRREDILKGEFDVDSHRGVRYQDFMASFQDKLRYQLVKEPMMATAYDRYLSISYAIRDRLVENWVSTQKTYRHNKVKRVYYLSLEFLIGRTLGNSVINLEAYDQVAKALAELGMDLEEVREAETDAGLGNGGLGRLAACYMDSLATLEIPAYGYGIRYDYGIFRQKIIRGYQVEEPDEWLSKANPWEISRPEYTYRIKFGGHVVERANRTGKAVFDWVGTDDVLAMAYDMPVPGYANKTVNNLRLWSAKATEDFDLDFFNKGDYFAATSKKTETESISKVLYPNDNSPEGRELRLKQQYFFVSASIQDIVRRFKREHTDLKELPDAASIQLNDTHPTIGIAEFMRVMLDEEGLDWDQAWEMTKAIFAYTNHTLLPEALEKWQTSLFGRLFPRHIQIIQEINARFLREVANRYPGDTDRLRRMSIFEEGNDPHIRMAYLAIIGSHSVNGVSALHSELLKTSTLKDFYELYPERFNNKTNGITQRRWLKKCNPELSKLITSRIGDKWVKNLFELKKLEKFAKDKKFQAEWRAVKNIRKEIMAKIVADEQRLAVDPTSLFDVQVKRIHEYKRQLLNALHVISLYRRIKANPDAPFVPRTVFFGGKAAPGYYTAKLIIKFINAIGDVVNHDPQIKGKLMVVFLPNYRVSLAEKIMPASDLSEQISTAGKEASGTGNMKFALNGALTIGTLDGANIEIGEEVGDDNIFIFGLKTEEVAHLKSTGYNPRDYYQKSAELTGVMDLISSGFFSPENPDLFKPLYDSLMNHDEYMLLADFDDYVACQDRVSEAYKDQNKWTEMAILNVARMGKFSSDRAIQEYCDDIWDIKPVKIS
ncbi:MAG TPA: glycogen/starch/alpha-glucan phosphorylase [bacterium]|jgi:starch phosphorylase|nr:glycogen/starch/alpha-glucan phosphorylase [bacterium]